MSMSHRVYWTRPIGGRSRKNEPCTILRQKGKLAQVRFEDGTTALINRMGLRSNPKVLQIEPPSA